MKIGATLLVGMLCLVVLGYLFRYSFDAAQTIQSLKEENAQLALENTQLRESLSSVEAQNSALDQQIGVLTANLIGIQDNLISCQVEMNSRAARQQQTGTSITIDRGNAFQPGADQGGLVENPLLASSTVPNWVIGGSLGVILVFAVLFLLFKNKINQSLSMPQTTHKPGSAGQIMMIVSRNEALLISKNRRERLV